MTTDLAMLTENASNDVTMQLSKGVEASCSKELVSFCDVEVQVLRIVQHSLGWNDAAINASKNVHKCLISHASQLSPGCAGLFQDVLVPTQEPKKHIDSDSNDSDRRKGHGHHPKHHRHNHHHGHHHRRYNRHGEFPQQSGGINVYVENGNGNGRAFEGRHHELESGYHHGHKHHGGAHIALPIFMLPFFVVGVYMTIKKAHRYIKQRRGAGVSVFGTENNNGHVPEYMPLKNQLDG